MNRQTSKETAVCTFRCFAGPEADEIHIHCRPLPDGPGDITSQTLSLYKAVDSLLRQQRGSLENLVYETVFFRNIRKDLEGFERARLQALAGNSGRRNQTPAPIFIEQAPLAGTADLAANAIAVIPHAERPAGEQQSFGNARSLVLGGERLLYAGNIYGPPGDAFDQTSGMFQAAAEVLARAGMNFSNVVRTWIYLREMERDYGEFNRARRRFFRQHEVTLLPASTGIEGSAFPKHADFALGFYAVKPRGRLDASAMTTSTLNEACTYGSDFSRGLRVVEANKVALYISGTASVDEEGRTAHRDDFSAQVDRMLLNVETLLAAQGASFQDILSAVTYIKTPADAPVFQRIMRDKGLDGIPNAIVHAAVCRPDLLCEMEAIAAQPVRG